MEIACEICGRIGKLGSLAPGFHDIQHKWTCITCWKIQEGIITNKEPPDTLAFPEYGPNEEGIMN